MVTAVIAAIAGLLGVAVGRFWDSHAESVRWRRDQRVRGYEDLAKEFYLYRATIRQCVDLDLDATGRGTVIAALHNHHAIWNERLTSVWVHGSESAATAAYALDHELSILSDVVVNQHLPISEWRTGKEAVQQRFDDYIDAVRADLSLPHLQVLRTNAADRVELTGNRRTH